MIEVTLDAQTEQDVSPIEQTKLQMGWRYALASVIGTSHGTAGTPCQDACDCRLFWEEGASPVLVAVVSDGAGSATRSQDGAAFACSLFVAEMESYFSKGGLVLS